MLGLRGSDTGYARVKGCLVGIRPEQASWHHGAKWLGKVIAPVHTVRLEVGIVWRCVH